MGPHKNKREKKNTESLAALKGVKTENVTKRYSKRKFPAALKNEIGEKYKNKQFKGDSKLTDVNLPCQSLVMNNNMNTIKKIQNRRDSITKTSHPVSFEDIERKIFDSPVKRAGPSKEQRPCSKMKHFTNTNNKSSSRTKEKPHYCIADYQSGTNKKIYKSDDCIANRYKITNEKLNMKSENHKKRISEKQDTQKDEKNKNSKLNLGKISSKAKHETKRIKIHKQSTATKEEFIKDLKTEKQKELGKSKSKNNNLHSRGKSNNSMKTESLNKGRKEENSKKNLSDSAKKNHASKSTKNIELDFNSDVDFDAVEDLEEILNTQKVEKETVQIELESTNVMWGMTKRKKKSHREMVEDYLRKRINRGMKEVQENMHKTHLLCLIAHGRYVNGILNSEEIMASALAVVDNKKIYPDKRLNIGHLELVIKWYKKKISVSDKSDLDKLLPLKQKLLKRFESKKAYSKEEFTLMFLALLRILGINGRLIFNLVPLSWKVGTKLLIKPKKSSELKAEDICGKPQKSHATASTSKKPPKQQDFSSDSDFSTEIEVRPTKRKLKSVKSPEPEKLAKKYLTYWIEVYTEEEEQWISLDVVAGEIHHSSEEFERRLPPQSGYILAYNNDLTFKDVTKRYVHNWLSCKNKVRFDPDWWQKSISNFRGVFTKMDTEEDEVLNNFLEKQPLPKTMASYKNHALYALQRHLLKFEALYPPGVSPVGFFRGEPVFARSCVRELHGREKWIKEAKTVIVDEEPYKIVKARPKWDKATSTVLKDRPLELFGEWQVEDYEPPTAANGKVPRNEYGNVELFKPSMLPKGCVYINVGGINKLARKLGIDCAPAITGFDFHGGWTHPVCEGYVVCEEFQDLLMDAWRQDQLEVAKRNEERRLRDIYGHWKRLIKSVMVRERIKEKYGDVVEKEAAERSAKRPKEKKRRIKVKHEGISGPEPAAKRDAPILKVDLQTSAVEATRRQNGGKSMSLHLDDSSEEEATVEQKQEKIRTILSWTPGLSQNPDLSDSDEGTVPHDSSPMPPIKRLTKARSPEPSLSEGSTTESETDFVTETKTRSKRNRSRVTYKMDSDPEDIFTDSDDDKTFEPDRKRAK